MKIDEVNIDPIKKVIKCEEGEFVFVTYDSTKDPDMTSDVLEEVISYCQDNGCKCLCLPETNEKIAVALQDYDAESLRRLEGLVHQALQKKSKIILS